MTTAGCGAGVGMLGAGIGAGAGAGAEMGTDTGATGKTGADAGACAATTPVPRLTGGGGIALVPDRGRAVSPMLEIECRSMPTNGNTSFAD